MFADKVMSGMAGNNIVSLATPQMRDHPGSKTRGLGGGRWKVCYGGLQLCRLKGQKFLAFQASCLTHDTMF